MVKYKDPRRLRSSTKDPRRLRSRETKAKAGWMEGPWKDQMGPMEGSDGSDGRSWNIRWKVMEHQMEGHGASDGRPWNIRWKDGWPTWTKGGG